MAARSSFPVCPVSADETLYRHLLAEFETAHQAMKDSSREYTAVLMTTPSEGLTAEERRAGLDSAAETYRAAQEHFVAAARNLQEFTIASIASPSFSVRCDLSRKRA